MVASIGAVANPSQGANYYKYILFTIGYTDQAHLGACGRRQGLVSEKVSCLLDTHVVDFVRRLI